MKQAHAAALIALLLISTASVAQVGRSIHRDAPTERFPGDPIQGGALKEHRASPSRGHLPVAPDDHSRINSESSSGSSAGSSSGATQTYRSSDIDTSRMPPPAPAAELMVQSSNGVSWLCGGIGEREVTSMKHEARRYDMMLTFAARNGAYLADVNVTILGPNGSQLVQTQCEGPIMLLNVPGSGAYRIRAEVEGHEVTQGVQIQDGRGQHRHVVMTWPASTAGMFSGPASSGASDDFDEDSSSPVVD